MTTGRADAGGRADPIGKAGLIGPADTGGSSGTGDRADTSGRTDTSVHMRLTDRPRRSRRTGTGEPRAHGRVAVNTTSTGSANLSAPKNAE